MLLDKNTIQEAFGLIGDDRRFTIAMLAGAALGTEVTIEAVHISGFSGCQFACEFTIDEHILSGDMTEREVNFKGEVETCIYNPLFTKESSEAQLTLAGA